MAKMNSGERRASILLVILIVALITGMLVFYRKEAYAPKPAPKSPQITDTINVFPANPGKDRKHARRKRSDAADSSSVHGKKKSSRHVKDRTGRSRDYLDEPVD